MPPLSPTARKTRILEKLAERAAARKEDTVNADHPDPLSNRGFFSHLEHLFPLNARKKLASLTDSVANGNEHDTSDLRELTQNFMLEGEEKVKSACPELLMMLGRQSYESGTPEDGEREKISIFRAVTTVTARTYARHLASFLSFCFLVIGDESMREECGLKMKDEMMDALESFHDLFEEGVADTCSLIDLLVTLSALEFTRREDYNADAFCSFAIGCLYDGASGEFDPKGPASKTLSAFKYSFRLAILYKLEDDDDADIDLIHRVRWKLLGKKRPFKMLTILHKGVNALPRKLKPAASVLDKNCERVSYDGIPCSFDLLNDVLHSTIEKAKGQLNGLLMGFVPEDIEEEGFGYSSIPFAAHFAFGQNSESEYGDISLFNYVLGHAKWSKHFYGSKRSNAKRSSARAFLRSCQKLEQSLVVIMHILLGCGPRATDYARLTFMNGNVESQARTVSIYDDDFLHCVIGNSKLTQLRGRCKAYSVFLPRKLVDPIFVAYWKYVRPFALMLKEGLGSKQSYHRWHRYCFVQACDEKWVRRVICEALGGKETRRTFQWLRHAAIFLMRMFVRGAIPAPSLPVYKLFGHSESTDACYAVEKLSGYTSESCTNTTDVRLILSVYWQKIDLEERKANPTDVVEVDESDSGNEYDDEEEGHDEADNDDEGCNADEPLSDSDSSQTSASPTSEMGDSGDQDSTAEADAGELAQAEDASSMSADPEDATEDASTADGLSGPQTEASEFSAPTLTSPEPSDTAHTASLDSSGRFIDRQHVMPDQILHR